MSEIPTWYGLLILTAAAFRTWRLLAEDTVLDPIRERLVGLVGWEEGMPNPPGYRRKLAEFLTCPWCMGFWVCMAWWLVWQWIPGETIWFGVLWTMSAGVGWLAKLTSSDD